MKRFGSPEMLHTDTSGRPDSSSTYATQLPSGENRASRSANGASRSGRPTPSSALTVQTSAPPAAITFTRNGAVGTPIAGLAVIGRTRERSYDAGTAAAAMCRFLGAPGLPGKLPDTYASCCPSGDQTNCKSGSTPLVTRTRVARSKSSTQMSGLLRKGSTRWRAMRRPSGDTRGQFCASGSSQTHALTVARDRLESIAGRYRAFRKREYISRSAQHRGVIQRAVGGRERQHPRRPCLSFAPPHRNAHVYPAACNREQRTFVGSGQRRKYRVGLERKSGAAAREGAPSTRPRYTPALASSVGRVKYKKWFPSGRNTGQRWASPTAG